MISNKYRRSGKNNIFIPDSFTQMIWKDTTSIGCSMLKKKDEYYVVVHYLRKGNQPGFFMTNVDMPVKSKQTLFPRLIGFIQRLVYAFYSRVQCKFVFML